jgi:hypothetical protein
METAPIALFVYDRPFHLHETIASLKENGLATHSDLYVYSDGPRNRQAIERVREVRRYATAITGFRRVVTTTHETNQGLALSVINGVTELCERHGRVIVLEDDLVVSPYFLEFMNRALEKYEPIHRVMNVCGYAPPLREPEKLPKVFFSYTSSSWGWATWGRAWRRFEADPVRLLNDIRSRHREFEFDVQGSMPFTHMLERQARGELDSWAIRWYASTFLHDGLCLHPRHSLVRNIGHDGSGTHCATTSAFDTALSVNPVDKFPDEIETAQEAIRAFAEFYRSVPLPFGQRMRKGLRRLGKAVRWRRADPAR